MKVLVVTGIYPPDIGGPATFTPRLARYLNNKGALVEVITFADLLVEARDDAKWKVIRVKRRRIRLLSFVQISWKIWKSIQDADVVIANGLYEEVGLVLRLRMRPSLAKIVGDPIWERSRNRGNTTLSIADFNSKHLFGSELITRRLLVFSLNSFSSVAAPSKELCEMIKKWGIKRQPSFIPNGIACIEAPSPTTKKFDVVSVSRLVKWKNIENVIKACAQVGATLAIVGDGPERSALEELAGQESVTCQFFGRLNSFETAGVLNTSRIYVSISEYEGLSFSLLEAMHSGLPLVVSDRSGNRELFKEVNFVPLVDPSNVNKIGEEIMKFLKSSELRSSTGFKLRELAREKYCEERQLRLFFESVAKS